MADLSVGTDAMKSKHIERIRAAYYEQSLTPEDSGYDQDDCDMPFMKSPPCPGDTNYDIVIAFHQACDQRGVETGDRGARPH